MKWIAELEDKTFYDKDPERSWWERALSAISSGVSFLHSPDYIQLYAIALAMGDLNAVWAVLEGHFTLMDSGGIGWGEGGGNPLDHAARPCFNGGMGLWDYGGVALWRLYR